MSDTLAVAIPVILYMLGLVIVIGGLYRAMATEERAVQEGRDH